MFRLACGLVVVAMLGMGCQQSTTTTSSSASQTSVGATSGPGTAPASPGSGSGASRMTPSGLKIEELQIGTGAEAVRGKLVSVHYTGRLMDGTKFDSSLDRGVPYELTLGAGEVIPGWDEGLVGMKVGGKRRLTIPPHLAYGERGYAGVIPPNATLQFECELMDVK